jgi:hypothetical protein
MVVEKLRAEVEACISLREGFAGMSAEEAAEFLIQVCTICTQN